MALNNYLSLLLTHLSFGWAQLGGSCFESYVVAIRFLLGLELSKGSSGLAPKMAPFCCRSLGPLVLHDFPSSSHSVSSSRPFHLARSLHSMVAAEYLHFLHDNWLLKVESRGCLPSKWPHLKQVQCHFCHILWVIPVTAPAQIEGGGETVSTSWWESGNRTAEIYVGWEIALLTSLETTICHRWALCAARVEGPQSLELTSSRQARHLTSNYEIKHIFPHLKARP